MADSLFEKGLKVRKQVLGSQYVDRQLKIADEFTRPMQDLATEAGWGLVWARPGLTRKERSICTLCFVTARGKADELALHLRGAVRNGVTKAEIREILLQSAIYCGFPEGLGAFRVAREFFNREGDKLLAERAQRSKVRKGKPSGRSAARAK